MVDAHLHLHMQIIFFPVDLVIIMAVYLLAHQLIVVLMLGLMDHFIVGWDPGPGPHCPST